MEPATQFATQSACIVHPDQPTATEFVRYCVACCAGQRIGRPVVGLTAQQNAERADRAARFAARAACTTCATPGIHPSHDGSELCRMRSSIASGGTEAHCACAACF